MFAGLLRAARQPLRYTYKRSVFAHGRAYKSDHNGFYMVRPTCTQLAATANLYRRTLENLDGPIWRADPDKLKRMLDDAVKCELMAYQHWDYLQTFPRGDGARPPP